MRRFLTLWGRELRSGFLSPTAYVTTVVFLLLSNVTFFTQVVRNVGRDEPVVLMLTASVTIWLTLLMTLICMRLFAEERRVGTLETLLTAPVSDAEVVLGKYAGAVSLLFWSLVPALVSIFVLDWFSPGYGPVSWAEFGGAALFLLLFSLFGLALGEVLSLLTANQIVAAICCFSAYWLILLAGWIWQFLPFGGRGSDAYSALLQMEDFSRGIVSLQPVVFYISGTIYLLFLAIRILESRRWR